MGIFTVPNSNGEGELREFNPNHEPGGSSKGGEFAKGKGDFLPGMGPKKSPAEGDGSYKQPKAIKVKDINEAVRLVLEGKVVELPDTRHVNTILKKFHDLVQDAVKKGDKAPNIDLCNVTVPKTNLFCASSVKDKDHPEGYARIHMPQLGGEAVPGSQASKLKPRAGHATEIDGSDAFIAHVKSLGIRTSEGEVPAARLKASQKEIKGATVAGMVSNPNYDPTKGRIFISRDNYVIDGHHRWAAVVGRDAADGHLGDLKMKVVRINAPISEVLHLANDWANKFGIAPAAGPGGRK